MREAGERILILLEENNRRIDSLIQLPELAPLQPPAEPCRGAASAAAPLLSPGASARQQRPGPVCLRHLAGAYVYEVSQMKQLWLFN